MQIDTDLLHIITSTAIDLSGDTNGTPKIEVLVDF